MGKIDPRTAEAARALGASRNRAWWTVTVPQLMPAITSAGAVVFLFCATAFGTVMVLGGQGYGTIETEIWVQTVQFLDLRTAAVLSVLQLLVIATALWISATARTRQERALTLLTATITGRPLTWRRDWFPTLITLTTTTGLLAWPLLNLTTAAFRDANGNWTLTNFTALTTRGDNNTLNVTVFDALTNSLIIAFYATLTALIIGGLVAYVASRRPTTPTGKRAITTLDALFMLPLGVSAVTVGFGFLITLNQPLGLPIDLRTNGILVPIAQAVVATPSSYAPSYPSSAQSTPTNTTPPQPSAHPDGKSPPPSTGPSPPEPSPSPPAWPSPYPSANSEPPHSSPAPTPPPSPSSSSDSSPNPEPTTTAWPWPHHSSSRSSPPPS